ncbi:ribonuclease D [Miltoncostaea marina]|uniref:ribonuclease D n=1 Tax=Miltoncostaea marina TaxID=2843215 RepID=UPI001C3E53EC|nr:HRDC domain-containing protein [Miltoncostaea marina]
MSPPKPIIDPAGVDAVVAEARRQGRVALDLEFLWERTYAPVACLAQLALPSGEVHIVDPIDGAPLGPVAELVADPQVEVVMHAPSADLTLLGLAHGVRPQRLVDVQIIAGFVGLGAGQGLATLLQRVLKVRHDKGERYTDWSKRPLSAAQLRYAAGDVDHLLELADELAARGARLGRTDWIAEEHERRYGPQARLVPDPATAWRRVKGGGRLTPQDRAVLASIAAWREREAARRDKPASWVVPDRTLVEMAHRRPADRQALEGERGLPARMRGDEADGLLRAIREGAEAPPIRGGSPPPPEVQQRLEVLGPLGAVLVTARAAAADLAPSLVATRDEIAAFLAAAIDGDLDGQGLASGWRRDLVGDALVDLARGRIALGVDPERPYLAEIPRGATGGGG